MTVHRADVVLDAELFRLAQEAFAAGDLEGVATLLQKKAATVRALRTEAPEGAVRQGGLPQADLEHTSEMRAPRSQTVRRSHEAPTSPAQGDGAPASVAGAERRVSWLTRAFVACNRDRRFAWGELNRENHRAVAAERERDALQAQVEGRTAKELTRRLVRARMDYVRDLATLTDGIALRDIERSRLERLLDDARLRGYLPELADADKRPGPHTKYMPLENTPIDVLLDSLEQAYERSPEEGWWPWVWALINRLYAAVDGVEPDAVRNAAIDAATDAVILVKAIEDGSDEALSYARKIADRLKLWYQGDADA